MPESLGATTRSGLFTVDAVDVPLAGVAVEAEIANFCARVAVSQRYVNRESRPIEAVYVFPLDEGAAVCGFEAVIDGTLVVGEVKEREDAFRTYDDAMERGHGAFLLDMERPDVFQASVGNLPPGKEVVIRITYVTELVAAGPGLRFTIPTTVSPRYAPAEDHRGIGRPDSEALNPPRALSVPYGLTLSVRLAMQGAITRVESPSHPISVTMSGRSAGVMLARQDVALDRDFVLSVECEGLNTPQAWIERGDGGQHAVAVAFVPRLEQATTSCDVTFLVDRSGSMEGSSIDEVRNALQLCLRSMTPGCTFNIVGFGSTCAPLFPRSRPYDDASLAEASAYVAALEANLGGTEILPALQFVLEQPSVEGGCRQVVVMTDGEVTNTDAVLALVKQHGATNRVFTFGIGAGASQHLVNGIARAGGGLAEFIHPGERIEPKIVRLFGGLLSPALTDVAISWGGLDARPAPSKVPPVFAGHRLLVYAFFTEGTGGQLPARVTLAATSPAGPLRFELTLDPALFADGRTVATLAARARIRELEESPEWATARGSRQRERKATGVSREIIDLSTRYGLISRETSFVAIERRETPVAGEVQLRRVPIALTTGWAGVGARLGATRPARQDWSLAGASELSAVMFSRGDHDTADEDTGNHVAYMRSAPMAAPRRSGAGRQDPDHRRNSGSGVHAAMMRLMALQSAEGSWELDTDLGRAIEHDLHILEAALRDAIGSIREMRRALATALALTWLDEHARMFQAEWGMAADKARQWLAHVHAQPANGGSWAEAAARLTARSG